MIRARIASPYFLLLFAAVSCAQAAPAQTASDPFSSSSAPTSATGPSPRLQKEAANAYLAGARLLDRNDLLGAENNFRKAVALDGANRDYATALTIAREHRLTSLVQQAGLARNQGQTARAEALLAEARTLDPQNEIVTQHALPSTAASNFATHTDADAARTIAGPIELTPAAGARSFHIHADTETVVRQVYENFGIKATFEEAPAQQQVRFDLEGTSYAQTLPILLQMTHLFAVPLTATSVLLTRDTLENRQRLERQVEETIYVPGSTPEQMTEIGNLLRTVFDVRSSVVQNTGGSLALRAPAETVNALNLTLADLLDGNAEVLIDLRLYAIDATRTRAIGPQVPQQFGVYSVASAAQSLVSANQTLVNQAIAQGLIPATASNIQIALYLLASGLVQSSLLSDTIGFFGNGLTLAGVTGVGTTSFTLALNSSDARALDNIQIRIGDRQQSTFRAGTRFPITTATYTSGSAVSSSSLAGVTVNGVSASSLLSQYLGSANSVTVPQIQYEDLGVTLKTTPVVQRSDRVAMHLDLKIEALAGGTLDNIPILSNRQFVSDITVADGETALMISSLSKTESTAITGIPGLGELPGFQSATAERTGEKDTSQLVLLITPHIVRHRLNTVAGPRIALNQPPGSSE